MVVEPEPMIEAGLKATVAPCGSPLALKVTVPPNPADGAMVTVYAAPVPRDTVCVGGVADMEKSGGGGALKKIPFTMALAPAVQVTRMVTCPLRFHSSHSPLLNAEMVRLSRAVPVTASAMLMVSTRPLFSQSRQYRPISC